MTNLEQIKQAYAWNYGAVYQTDDSSEKRTIINILDGKTFVNDIGGYLPIVQMNMKGFKLIGFRYLGELGGNEKIPEGQKFKVKETGKVMPFVNWCENDVCTIELDTGKIYLTYYKSEIEPYFES